MAWLDIAVSGSSPLFRNVRVDNAVTASFFKGDGSALTNVTGSPSPSASYAITASYTQAVGPEASIQFKDGPGLSGSSDFQFDKINRILKLSGAVTFNAITASGNLDNYLQINIQNQSSATTSSADIVATNNTGTELGNYIDMGINSSGYNQPNLLGGPNDGYLYTTGSKLIIGNTTPSSHPSSSIYFVVGGSNQSTNTKMIISSSGQVSASSYIGNGSGLTGLPKTIGLTIDGGGSSITTGIKGDITIPFNGTITSWYLIADQAGSIVIDVWKDTFANYPPTVIDSIAGTEKPTLSGVSKNSNTSFTTFTGSVSIGDTIRFNVDSAATVTRVNLILNAVTR